MDASTEAHLQKLSQGQSSSRQVREQTGLSYSQMLDALAELGLRLPSFDYETANEEVKRGHDNLLAYFIAQKGTEDSSAGKLALSSSDDGASNGK
jgi:hypothetical protein